MRNLKCSIVMCTALLMSLGVAAVQPAPAAADPVIPVAPPDNPFAGSWSGTFVNLNSGNGGVLEWTIDANGRLRGTYLWDNGDAGEFVGTVKPGGRLHTASPRGGGGFHGDAVIDDNGDMIVSATDDDSGAIYHVELSPV